MGLRKGQTPKIFEENKKKYNFKNLPPERRKEISKLGAEAREKKHNEKKFLQKCLREILMLKPSSDKQIELLKQIGVPDEEATNHALLMFALFKKGVTGDVAAISKIVEMMEKLELFEDGKQENGQSIIINLLSTGEQYIPTEQDEQDIWKAENGIPLEKPEDMESWETDSTDEDWGEDVYDG